METLLIDTDVHEYLRSTEDLLPYLSPVWQRFITDYGWRVLDIANGWPYAPTAPKRANWILADGTMATDVVKLGEHLFDEETRVDRDPQRALPRVGAAGRVRLRQGARVRVQRLADRELARERQAPARVDPRRRPRSGCRSVRDRPRRGSSADRPGLPAARNRPPVRRPAISTDLRSSVTARSRRRASPRGSHEDGARAFRATSSSGIRWRRRRPA